MKFSLTFTVTALNGMNRTSEQKKNDDFYFYNKRLSKQT